MSFLFLSSVSATQTYLNESQQWQQNLTKVSFGSTALGDIDNDGDLDLVLTGHRTSSIAKIYINNGSTLTENSTWQQNLTGVNYGSLAFGDIDNDGDLDLALGGCSNGGNGLVATCNDGGYQTFIYLNNGTSFVESQQWQNNLTKSWKGSLAFGDIDNDGDLDLALSGQSSSSKISKIYINNGTSLVENSQWQGNLTAVYESSLAFGDIDNDGDLDLALCGDAGISDERSKIYINNGTSLIENSIWQQNLLNVDWCSLAFADFDNEGDLDFSLIGHTTQDNHRIYRNNGTSFVQISPPEYGGGMAGIYGGSISFGDYNTDGFLDIIANGWEGHTTLYLYNSSVNNFTLDTQDPESHILNVEASSIVWIDLDNDNDLDLIETGVNSTPEDDARIYISNRSLTKNNTPPNASISGFSSSYSDGVLNLSWGNGSDSETNTSGLYYNLMVGNSTTNHTIVSGVYGGSSNPTAGYFGNMMQRKSISLNKYLSAGTYNWYVQTIDTGLAKSNWSAMQSIVIGADATAPVISSISSSVTSSTATITWTTDETSNSSVYYGTTIATTSSSGSDDLVTSHSISLTGLSASTLYYYNVSSCDYWNNCNTSSQHTFTTSAAPSNGNGGNGGGGSGGITPFWAKTYTISDKEFSEGFIKELEKKQRVKISVNNESHYVGVVNLTNTTATINITSNPIQIILSIGEEAKVDVLDDGFYDIYVLLNDINESKVNLTIQSIHEEIPEGEGAVITTGEEIGEEEEEEKKKRLWLYGLIGVGIVVIIVILFYLKKHLWKREFKNRSKKWQK